MEGVALCSHWNHSLLRVLICLPCLWYFCQNPMDSQSPLFTIWVFYPALLLNRKLILQQMKCGNGLVFMEVTGLVMFPTTLEQPAWHNDGLATWSISHSTKWMTPPCRVRAVPWRVLQIPWINNRTVVPLLLEFGLTDLSTRHEAITLGNISDLLWNK